MNYFSAHVPPVAIPVVLTDPSYYLLLNTWPYAKPFFPKVAWSYKFYEIWNTHSVPCSSQNGGGDFFPSSSILHGRTLWVSCGYANTKSMGNVNLWACITHNGNQLLDWNLEFVNIPCSSWGSQSNLCPCSFQFFVLCCGCNETKVSGECQSLSVHNSQKELSKGFKIGYHSYYNAKNKL